MEFMELIYAKVNQALVGPNIWDIRHSIIDSDCYIWLNIDYFLPWSVIYMQLFCTCPLTLFPW